MRWWSLFVLAAMTIISGSWLLHGQVYKDNLPTDHPSIQYYKTSVSDPTSHLKVPASKDTLGLLSNLLHELRINTDSQMLVFSKTSFQATKISPDNPRAIYFNDNVAVAYVRDSDSLEVAALDPSLGPIFYVVTADKDGHPQFVRSEKCLQCHQGPNTSGVPGLYIGSVIPSPSGAPLRDDTAIVTDHRTEFKDRWGGWYVNAKRGEQLDRANAVAMNPADPSELVRESQQNLQSLIGKFKPAGYLATLSDIVALMTFEHQTQMVNYLTRLNWQARMGQRPDIDEAVAYLLFAKEAPLTEPIEGVSTFTQSFPQTGPRDRKGRSLRDFDLQTRLFKYSLSYMIYSETFDKLPADLRQAIYARLYEIMSGKDQSKDFAYLSTADRRAILEIVRDTKPDLPSYWKESNR